MNYRTKVKVIFLISTILVCAYLALPVFNARSGQLDRPAGQSQSGIVNMYQVSQRQAAPGLSREGEGRYPSLLESALAINDAQRPVNGQRNGQFAQAMKQDARQQQENLNPNQNVFAQSAHRPVRQGVVLQQGIPQNGVEPNQGILLNRAASNQGISQNGGGSNQGNVQQIHGSNQGVSQNGAASNQGVSQGDIISVQDNRQEKTGQPDNANVNQPDVSVLIAEQLGLHPDVRIVSSQPPTDANTAAIECVPLPMSPRTDVKICIYPIQEDKWVSGSLKMNRLWEEDLVLAMGKALQTDPSMMLMDLGCNLGMYALYAAAMGRSVLAVEMLPSNVVMIQKSLQLSGLGGKVLIVNNALYRDHRTLQTRFMAQNVGGSRLNTSKVYENVDPNKPIVSVRTICLDDLSPLLKSRSVFMKMDIENSEHHALACAHKLFTEVNVKVVQIEWLHRTPEESKVISDFMTQHNYVLSRSAMTYSPLADSSHISKADVYFLKKSAFNIL